MKPQEFFWVKPGTIEVMVMDLKTIEKYIGRRILFKTRLGFKYIIILKQEYIKDNIISFNKQNGDPVDIDISEITFVSYSKDRQLLLP